MRRVKGFTLIELLVVIAIIGILAAMLFPVFARARESARKTQCLSNVKNIAMAFQMYLTDYDSFPPGGSAEMRDYLIEATGNECCCYAYKADPYAKVPVILDEYIKNRDVWRCPSATVYLGVGVVVADYGKGAVAQYRDNYAIWFNEDYAHPCLDPGAFPPGWGGSVTDTFRQGLSAGPGTGAVDITIGWSGLNIGMKVSSIEDPAMHLVCGDASMSHTALQQYRDWAYTLCKVGCAPLPCCDGGADWANCPDTRTCGLDKNLRDEWRSDASLRGKYTRHLGGINVGFADGHAKWWHSEAFMNQAPYCENDVIYTEGRPLRGGCPK